MPAFHNRQDKYFPPAKSQGSMAAWEKEINEHEKLGNSSAIGAQSHSNVPTLFRLV